MNNLLQLCQEEVDALHTAGNLTPHTIDQVKSKYLGKQSELSKQYQGMRDLAPDQRKDAGKQLNIVRQGLESIIKEAYILAEQTEINAELAQALDVTAKGRPLPEGSLHPLTHAYNEINKIFTQMGFSVVTGPEVEDAYHNFYALNFPENHPAITMHDTFHLTEEDRLLRTHTSTVQVHAMKKLQAPFRIATPGRVYRCDHDATHSPMFNQVECMVVSENCSFANVKWLLLKFCETYLGKELAYRFRPSFFPFTEPSAELDIKWGDQWMELAGCGMVHPNVLKEAGIDHNKYRGFAFGVGIDRLAMLKYNISDLRVLYENHVEFLKQFNASL
ncbi:phenylalanine--tRNA ligase subunit alpha [Candidatus Comchoanobacter bicostacola]|uniref:Phenylalanine--tRNA ligase alpha subunit n=1 Tax=Candidatus Comchoanobacter bicostacola TaxID=2919598 RepID=A0ABY5DJB3_9GAMM|nr:phenylalanine--tRNA ligase subunit alpha [Candidatus Comchoanobacter bicostacola]UTC24113.1 phenylalanine--tRNA ligase subunit alpha [Candidatus Comchoanobacter bicostacola]